MTFKIINLDRENSEVAFELATEVFVANSTLHKALNIELSEYRQYLRQDFEQMIDQNLSAVAVDVNTGTIAGCLIAADFYSELNSTGTPPNRFAPLKALTNSLCDVYKKHRTIGLGEAVLVDIGAVSSSHSGKGIYQKLRAFVQSEAKAKAKGFKWAIGELSSASTQHVILNKFNHQKIAEIRFPDFSFEGRYPFKDIGQPESIVLSEGKL